MKILAICQDYPNAERKDITGFVHTRNLYYRREGHDVEVLSFAARRSYEWEGIRVWCERDLPAVSGYDVSVFHAPNLRNAMRLLWLRRRLWKRVCFVIHGHEFLNWYRHLPPPFDFDLNLRGRVKRWVQKYYDRVKLRVWRWFFRRQREPRLGVIFVSQWMKDHAERDMGVRFADLAVHSTIIHNPIHVTFTESVYRTPVSPLADFVTVRSFDNPKYGVDLVVEIARRNPTRTFHMYGRGRYFDFHPPPPNMQVFHQKFRQTELPPLFAQYRCGLLATRQDTQGVLMCEMAAFGMPLLSSDLPVCQEMVGGFPNVAFFTNDNLPSELPIPPPNPQPNSKRFQSANTIARELEFFDSLPSLST